MKYFSPKTLFTIILCSILFAKAEAVSIPKGTFNNVSILPTKDSATLTDSAYTKALSDFKNLSKAEKKMRAKNAKKLLKEYKQNKKNGDDVKTDDILLAILCILLPPLAVYLHQNKQTNNKFWLSVVLSLLLWVPGIIYAILVVFFEF